MIRFVALGECMLEVQAQGFGAAQLACGGDTFNTAVYLRRCSDPSALTVHYATALGDDPLSAQLLQNWSAHGLDLTAVRRIPGRLPGLYLIETDDAGERRFHFWRDHSAARAYFSGDASTPLEAMAEQWDALYFSGISLAILDGASRDRLWALVGRVRQRGARVVFDNNYRPRLWPSAAAAARVFEQAYACADLCLITLDDHQAVHGCADMQAALEQVAGLPTPEVVVKRGAQSTLVRTALGEPWAAVAVQPVQHVVDTTAAGDSFAGGYLSRRLVGASALEAAACGNRLAAQVVQHRGAIIPVEHMPAQA